MTLTAHLIQTALNGNQFWMDKESLDFKVIEEATSLGYVRRNSHTQAEWTSQEAIDKLNYSIKKNKIDDDVCMYIVDEVFENVDEMIESKIGKEIYSGYENNIASKKRLLAPLFQKAYRIGNKIVYELLLAEGFKVLHELHLHSSLTNQAFCSYVITDGFLMIVKSKYANTPANRKEFAKQNINVTTIYGLWN